MYDGTRYHGWQSQRFEATVSQTVEAAIAKVTGQHVKLTGCGRTDAGVHAERYVANFRTESTISALRLPLALNAQLPGDISVIGAEDVPESFNAIGSCRRKEYTYKIFNARVRNPFYQKRAYFYPRPLDEAVMAEAAAKFVGRHDFAAVRSTGTNVRTTVRTVFYYEVERNGDIINLRVCADGFLYNMARAMAGTLIYASEGKLRPDDIGRILAEGNRCAAGPTVPPHGLYLTKLWYGGEADILANAEG